jgi:hypothetical protein
MTRRPRRQHGVHPDVVCVGAQGSDRSAAGVAGAARKPSVKARGGHGTEYAMPIPTITSPGEARAFVDARIAEGSDYITVA